MPRENRKRGKKHKKQNEEEPQYKEAYVEPQVESPAEPSWIVPAPAQVEEDNPEAPFGYVDVDVKAYFRTVDVQIRDWQDIQEESAGVDGDVDPNEHKRLFFTAALQEMQGKEKQLATDPDCSVILERMSYSMDDFVRRVFVDSLAGLYEGLVRHRFRLASKATISRETKAIMPAIPESEEQGELRTLTQLVLDICKELLPTFPSLIMDPSHPTSQSAVRSKKSAAWKARQGQMKSVFEEDKGKGKEAMRSAPAEFRQMARRLVEVVKEQLGENETRAMAANKVACPGLQMLLEVEADQDMSNQPGSLMDRVMVGVITACLQDPPSRVDESDYLGTLLRDPNSSHLLEIIVSRCPDKAFNAMWETYFKGKLARLAAHPVANFVLAKAVERLDGTWNKLIRTSRTGVLRAIVDRTSALKLPGQQIIEAVCLAFDLNAPEDKTMVVPCALTLLPVVEYSAAVANHPTHKQPPSQQHNSHRQGPPIQDPLEPKTQGSVLLQSLLRLPQPLNQFFTDSIYSLPVEERIKIAHNPSGSRVFDALLDSTTVPAKVKRQFVMDFIGHYHLLVDDKLGSRVGDRCWAFCDTYLKEKIARSLVNQEQTLAASYYGKFFARNLNLYLLQRRPEDWRNLQSERKRAQDQQQQQRQTTAPVPDHVPEKQLPAEQPETRKRKARPQNEIDALFDAKLGKRIKKAALVDVVPVSEAPVEVHPTKKEKVNDKELQQVLGAIRVAPANDGKKKRRN
ncbi:hypothetical protein BDZ97DRAFT_1834525 [Flammula alnicola]|nr:hypothetical protein BDZ97DRAFT_1834525 [Flammula alnicola]